MRKQHIAFVVLAGFFLLFQAVQATPLLGQGVNQLQEAVSSEQGFHPNTDFAPVSRPIPMIAVLILNLTAAEGAADQPLHYLQARSSAGAYTAAAAAAPAAPQGPHATCTVTSTADAGAGTLRECLTNWSSGDTIDFDPAVFPPTNPVTISVASELPYIESLSEVTIDGSNAGVILDGELLKDATPVDSTCAGLPLTSVPSGLSACSTDQLTIQGLQIVNFPGAAIAFYNVSDSVVGGDRNIGTAPLGQGNLFSGNEETGIWFEGASADNNHILGNYIGTELDGQTAWGNGMAGVAVILGASGNLIGGSTPSTRNLISGQSDAGIQIQDFLGLLGTVNNEVKGNLIGTDITGESIVSNGVGVALLGSENNTVGGETAVERNIISGNATTGISISAFGEQNEILGNYIGTNIDGSAALPNLAGILIVEGSSDNTIGGETAGARNIISGNDAEGIQIGNDGSDSNLVIGNYIGTDTTGLLALPNRNGIGLLDGAQNNIIGGDLPTQRNVISGNQGRGVIIQDTGTDSNQVMGNFIGTNATGTAALPNGEYGLSITLGAKQNTIGSELSSNVISGNEIGGVILHSENTTDNQVIGNLIGTDLTGTAAVGNESEGVIIDSEASNNIIGGQTEGARNVISGNTEGPGIVIQTLSDDNTIMGNYIGVNVSGSAALANAVGIRISNSTGTIIGGSTEAGQANVISGNTEQGIYLWENSSGTVILGNIIGLNPNGTAALPNEDGVTISGQANQNTVGGEETAARNIISGNLLSGITIADSGSSDNLVLNNYIGTDPLGLTAIGNGNGVLLIGGAQNNQIGSETAGNVISGNSSTADCCGQGLWLNGSGTSNNQIIGNIIGRNSLNDAPLPNSAHGILIAEGATRNTIGVNNIIRSNTKAGIAVTGITSINNTITENQIYDNGSSEILLDPPAIASPNMTMTEDPRTLTGTVCSECEVEIYGSQSSEPSGEEYLLTITAEVSGQFTVTNPVFNNWPHLSIIETDKEGFSKGFYNTVQEPPVEPSPPCEVLASGSHCIFIPLVSSGAPQGDNQHQAVLSVLYRRN